MEYTIYSETTVHYVLRDKSTQRWVRFKDDMLNSTNSLFEATRYNSYPKIHKLMNYLINERGLKDLEIRKVKMIDIGGVEYVNNND